MAILRRWRYDRRSEQLDVVQRSLLDETIDADFEAISLEIEALVTSGLNTVVIERFKTRRTLHSAAATSGGAVAIDGEVDDYRRT